MRRFAVATLENLHADVAGDRAVVWNGPSFQEVSVRDGLGRRDSAVPQADDHVDAPSLVSRTRSPVHILASHSRRSSTTEYREYSEEKQRSQRREGPPGYAQDFWYATLAHFPGPAGVDRVVQAARAALGRDLFDLAPHSGVEGRHLDAVQDPDRCGPGRRLHRG